MKIETFGPRQHPLTSYWPDDSEFQGKLQRSGLTFFNSRLIGLSAKQAVVAYDADGNIIGYFRFTMTPKTRRLYARGTWVAPKYRGKSIAADLWVFAIRKFRPASVKVFTISTGGRNLVQSLIAKDTFKYIKWIHEVV